MENQDSKYKKKIITIPNLLSLFRLLLIPVIVWLYVEKEAYTAATAVLVLSGLTDIIDGRIARKFNMISDFGKAFDPVADKLTQIAVLFCLVTRFPNMLLPLLLLTVKEISAAVLSLLVIRKTGTVYGAVWHGKVTTVLLYSTMILHLLWHQIPEVLSNVLIGACTAMLLLSAILYGRQNMRIMKGKNDVS